MSKLLRVLLITAIAAVLLVPGAVLAGPGGKGEAGDPESPQVAYPTGLDHRDLGDSDGKGTVNQGRTNRTKTSEFWVRLFSRYLRLVRPWGI